MDIKDKETQLKILNVYLTILLENVNSTNCTKIKLDELLHSDECIMFSKCSDISLTKQFQLHCHKHGFLYEGMSNIIPMDNAYSARVIVHILYNYPHLLTLDSINETIHVGSVLRTQSQNSADDICLNIRHYKVVKKPLNNMITLLSERDQPYSKQSPPKTLERHCFNALSDVDEDLLKSAHNASRSWSCPSSLLSNSKKTPPMEKWCSLLYYEMSHRVGDIFVPVSPIVTIDGYSYPFTSNSTRFSLGHLTNIFRSAKVEHTRHFIGKGAQLYYIQGELFLECLSDNAIFVQAPLYNIISGWHPATVIKIPPGCNIKIFKEDDFIKILKRYECKGFVMAYSLNPLCSIRISFVKGWGIAYSRQTITAAPCWVELHLNKPLKCLDEALRRLDGANIRCSSRS